MKWTVWRCTDSGINEAEMSVYLYVQKADGPITRADLEAAAEQVPHYTVQENEDGLVVEVPCGALGSAWLEHVPETGVLALQLYEGQGGYERVILNALRRFAGTIPNAFVEAEGQRFEALPWDEP
jgi:hypothetical protein